MKEEIGPPEEIAVSQPDKTEPGKNTPDKPQEERSAFPDKVSGVDPSLRKDYHKLIENRIPQIEWQGLYIAIRLSKVLHFDSTRKKRRLERAGLIHAMGRKETEDLFDQIGYNPGRGSWPLAVLVLPPDRVSFADEKQQDGSVRVHSVGPKAPKPPEDFVDLSRHRRQEIAQTARGEGGTQELLERIGRLEKTVSRLEEVVRTLAQLEELCQEQKEKIERLEQIVAILGKLSLRGREEELRLLEALGKLSND